MKKVHVEYVKLIADELGREAYQLAHLASAVDSPDLEERSFALDLRRDALMKALGPIIQDKWSWYLQITTRCYKFPSETQATRAMRNYLIRGGVYKGLLGAN